MKERVKQYCVSTVNDLYFLFLRNLYQKKTAHRETATLHKMLKVDHSKSLINNLLKVRVSDWTWKIEYSTLRNSWNITTNRTYSKKTNHVMKRYMPKISILLN